MIDLIKKLAIIYGDAAIMYGDASIIYGDAFNVFHVNIIKNKIYAKSQRLFKIITFQISRNTKAHLVKLKVAHTVTMTSIVGSKHFLHELFRVRAINVRSCFCKYVYIYIYIVHVRHTFISSLT